MTYRESGSGLSNATAAAVEELLAATLRDDADEMAAQKEVLEHEYNSGHCGIVPSIVVDLVCEAVDKLGLDVIDAWTQPDDGLGDVLAVLSDRGRRWFEVKAQTKKDRFGDLTQADWVRDETDFIRLMVSQDVSIANRLPAWALAALQVEKPDEYFGIWNRDSLWLADMALVVSREVREGGGIYTPDDLPEFLRSKHVLHLTRQGIRIVRLDALRPVASLLAGTPATIDVIDTNRTAVSIRLSCPGPPSWGSVHFTYHVAYPSGVLGRHKMHGLSLDDATSRIEVLT